MDSPLSQRFTGLRDVVCMYCAWSWVTGRPAEGSPAKCPKCGNAAGVEAFLLIKRAGYAPVVVTPAPWHL